ncbi:unnamed protein product [Agarophyton chilense]
MSEAVDAAYERSEQLRQQWEALKGEMLAIDPSQSNAVQRRDQLRTQMDHVMSQMSSVVRETRHLLPGSNAAEDDEPIEEARPVQYSARRRHVIYRTYDSSDSSNSSQSDSLSVPDELPKPPRKPAALQPPPSPPLSPTMDMSVFTSPTSREPPRDNAHVKRSSLANFKKGIRGKLRINDSTINTLREATSNEPTIPAPVAKKSRDHLLQEHNQLERESRRLKRKPFRSSQDDKRLMDIATALSRICSSLAEIPDTAPAQASKSSEDTSSPRRGQNESLPDKETMFSPLSEPGNSRPFDSNSEDFSRHARATASLHPKRKKGWGAIEAGFASFKALGRTVRHAAAGTGSRADPKHDLNSSRAKEKTKSIQNTQALISDTMDRVHERGEKLDGVAEESEHMANDANDMLAAARALNQRHKGGFFS